MVTDHAGKKIVWGAEGKDTATLDAFFDDLGSERAAQLEAVSMDMGAAFNKSVRAEGHAPQAVICVDPFHAVALVTTALDVVRRATWNELRQLPDQAAAKKFKNNNNARAEGLNNHVRLIIRRAYGFHSPTAALALAMLSCGPIELHLPHERTSR